MSSLQEYWDSIPPITRAYMSAVFGTTVAVSLKFLDPMSIAFFPESIIQKFEIWRLITNFFFFGPFSFTFLMQMMLIGRFGSGFENDPYATSQYRGSSDYLFAILFMMGVLLGIGYVMSLPILGQSLVFGIIYLWSKRNPESPVNVWGFRFTGSILPWVFIAFTVLMGGSPVPDLCGLAAAHLFYFLVEVLPLKTNKNYLTTPEFVVTLTKWISAGRNIGLQAEPGQAPRPSAAPSNNPWAQAARSQPATSTPAPAASGHSWGTGRRLG